MKIPFIDLGNSKEIATLKTEIEHLQKQVAEASGFIREIENGNLQIEASIELNNSEIGTTLISMRKHLLKIAQEESERTWANTGLAKFSDILRNKKSLDLRSLADEILMNLIKYIGANQGMIFILEEESQQEAYLESVACYAYDRKKFLNKRVLLGEGLTGQCVLEKQTIYLTDIPNDYVEITSGLGESTPRAVFICPLLVNEKVFGVIELGSFEEIQVYKQEFIIKLAENIASSIKNVKDVEKTQNLLNMSQMQSEALRAQEEEMRQNMEEMQATQEEMERKGTELSSAIAESESIIKGLNLKMGIIEFTPEGKILTANQNFLKSVNYSLSDIRGQMHRKFVPEEIVASAEYQTFWSQLAAGVSNSGIFKHINSEGKIIWLNAVYNPIVDGSGKVVKVTKFASDITAEREREEQTKKALEEIKLLKDVADETVFNLKVREDVFGMTTILSESDSFGNIIYANSKLAEVSKYSMDEMIGKPHNIFRHSDMPKELFALLWKAIQKGETFNGIVKNKAKDGSHYWVEGCFIPIKDEKGNLLKYVGARYHIQNEALALSKYNEQAKKLALPILK